MTRVALIVPSASYRTGDFVEAARRLSLEIVPVTDASQAFDGAVIAPLTEDPATAAAAVAASVGEVAAVVGIDDGGVEVAALASDLLRIAHNPLDAVAATRDKLAMRRRLDGLVPQPRFEALLPGDLPSFEGPWVVKATGLSGSRAVIRADSPAELNRAAERVRSIAGVDCLLVEEYIEGDEVAVEGLLVDERLETLAIFDKPDPLVGPFFEETIYVTPSRQPEPVQERIRVTTDRATAALGLVSGPIHAELRLGPDGPVVVEVAARSIGGLCGRALQFGLLGESLESLILRAAVGRPLGDTSRTGGASGVLMIPIPRAGVFEGVAGLDDVLALPHVTDAEITIRPGTDVVPLPEGDRYLGFVFARASEPSVVESALRAARTTLTVRIR